MRGTRIARTARACSGGPMSSPAPISTNSFAPLAVFVAAAWRLFADAVRRRGDPAATPLILVFCALAVMSAAHEMLYQRAFWLLLGAVLAMPASPPPGD